MDAYLWSAAYLAAVLETDNKKMSDRILEAEMAIRKRSRDVQVDPSEQRAIQDAVEGLKTLRVERSQPLPTGRQRRE